MSVTNLQRMLDEKQTRLRAMEAQARPPQQELLGWDIDRLVDDLPVYYREGARLWPKQQVIDTIIKRRFPELTELRDEVKRIERRIAEMQSNTAAYDRTYFRPRSW